MWIADGFDHGVVELADIVGNEVRQGGVRGVAPQCLNRVQIGSVGRQRLVREPVRAACPQALDRRAMDARAIELDDRRSALLTVQGIKA